ncbi:MAG: hypothetical protein ACTS27_01215 [Phycisphaerales bacterium]
MNLPAPSTAILGLATSSSMDGVRDLVDSAQGVQSLLPLLALGGIVAVGLALWALGGRFVKPSVVLVASATAGYLGFTFGSELDPTIGPWAGLALGVIAGAAIGHWLFRVAAGALLAAFLAVAAPTALAVAFDYDLADRAQSFVDAVRTAGDDDPQHDTDAAAPRSFAEQDDIPVHDAEDEQVTVRGVLGRAGAWMSGFLADTAEGGERIWNDLTPNEQRTIVASGMIGAIVGLGIGTLLPTFAMAVLTSGLGAAAMLGAGSALAVRLKPEWEANLPDAPIAWAAIWLSVAFLGAVLQIAPRRKRKKPSAPSDTE